MRPTCASPIITRIPADFEGGSGSNLRNAIIHSLFSGELGTTTTQPPTSQLESPHHCTKKKNDLLFLCGEESLLLLDTRESDPTDACTAEWRRTEDEEVKGCSCHISNKHDCNQSASPVPAATLRSKQAIVKSSFDNLSGAANESDGAEELTLFMIPRKHLINRKRRQ